MSELATYPLTTMATPVTLVCDQAGVTQTIVLSNAIIQSVAGGDGALMLTSGEWVPAPTLCRFRLVGTGELLVDAKNTAGDVTLQVYSVTAAQATDQIEYPFFGETAVFFRAVFPNTLTVQVL